MEIYGAICKTVAVLTAATFMTLAFDVFILRKQGRDIPKAIREAGMATEF